jgi:hypothetical protein
VCVTNQVTNSHSPQVGHAIRRGINTLQRERDPSRSPVAGQGAAAAAATGVGVRVRALNLGRLWVVVVSWIRWRSC